MSNVHLLGSLVLACVFAASASACAPDPPGPGPEHPPDPAPPAKITVMSFNIRVSYSNDGPDHWRLRRPLTFDVLRRHAPDLVGLQEPVRNQLNQIRKALPHFVEIGVARKDGRQKGEYCAILFDPRRLVLSEHGDFWFSDTPRVPGSKGWGNRTPRVCTWGRFIERGTGRSFYVFNVHLDHESQPSRERSAELLALRVLRRNHPEDPVIITGDFNASENSRVIRYLKGELPRATQGDGPPPPQVRFVDSFRAAHPEAKECATFHGFRGERRGPKIDYILVEPATDVISAAILYDNTNGRYPSDHYPLIARIRLTDPAGEPPPPAGDEHDKTAGKPPAGRNAKE